MGREMEQAWLREAIELTRRLWHAYFLESAEENTQFIFDTIDQESFSLIGTGKHEMCTDLPAFTSCLEHDQEEAQNISFEILDDYCEARPLDANSCLVFGTLWVREKSAECKPLLVEMDTRFSLVFRRAEDRWLLVHLHHSTPNVDQNRGEYYPKTATEQANAALAYSKALERRTELDSMTNLFNHRAFESHVTEALLRGCVGNTFFMIDLDNFKQVNDILGHPEGDRVIVEFSDVLSAVFSRDACVGRMGGDEFAVFTEYAFGKEDVEAKARELIGRWRARSDGRPVELGCSMGLVSAGQGQTFYELYRRADEALYASKRQGKGRFSW